MTRNTSVKIAVISAIFLATALASAYFVLAQGNCPLNTEAGQTTATLVGEIMDDGGDPDLQAWFQYGRTASYGSETSRQSHYGLGFFCANISNLQPGTTYHYRAASSNSAGTGYGEDMTFTTENVPISPANIDIKANNSDGPITISVRNNITLSWNSENADSCTASGDWSGTKGISGSQTIQLTSARTYIFNITCQNNSGTQTDNDSVRVVSTAIPPTVITKPAVITY